MDGNGRWAEERGLSHSEGHLAGARNIGKVVDAAAEMGIESLTLYAFSTENWKRPEPEVTALMQILKEFAVSELPAMMKNGVRLRTIGRTGDLPLASRLALLKAIDMTKNNTKFTINIALSYGGRAEIVDAVNKILKERKSDEPVTEEEFRSYLYLPDMPDPDLLIRTGGNLRVSNFLLWQISYSELYVTPTYWPDFGKDELAEAIDSFSGRERRFGGLNKK
jgi:undecaprenyl diphosphate synthase